MPARVTVRIAEGPMAGRDFVFEEHDTFLFGRSPDCQACLPDDPKVSRHHFLVEVNPPDVRIRDFGSLNGTYVNDTRHGGREEGETPEEGGKRQYPEVDLKDGDRIRVGHTVLTVMIEAPMFCCECGRDLAGTDPKDCAGPGGTYICPACKAKLAAAARPPAKPQPMRCKMCGRDVSEEVGGRRPGDYICLKCKRDPGELIKRLLELAKSGRKDLLAIQGYTIVRELGRGGMGAVYLARHERTGEQVALKVMLPRVAADERARNGFLREIENTKALKHPNVVELKDNGCSDGTFFFTLEFCDGGSVHKLIAKPGGRLSVDEAGRIILQALDGLEYAHSVPVKVTLRDGSTKDAVGVVHRDLSPQNIFLSGSGPSRVAKVADFGLGKAFDAAGLSGHTRTGMAAGKPWYMPRQQVVNFKYAKPDVDVWAAAACLYNMLTGQLPRDFKRGRDLWQTVLTTDPVPIRQRDPSIPKRLAEVVDHALIDKPDIPIKTAAELKRALEAVL